VFSISIQGVILALFQANYVTIRHNRMTITPQPALLS